VQLPNPFPEGTSVTIEIYKDEDFVETPATVAYVMPKRGMGLTFTGSEPQFAAVLKKWISQSKATACRACTRLSPFVPVCHHFAAPVTTVSKSAQRVLSDRFFAARN
jgi:hypothetical protein